jgi:hypothetical protein
MEHRTHWKPLLWLAACLPFSMVGACDEAAPIAEDGGRPPDVRSDGGGPAPGPLADGGGAGSDGGAVEPGPVDAGAPPVSTVDLALHRLDGAGGVALVSSGVPLPPGALMPDEVDRVRLSVGGEEQPVHVEPLAGRHGDGSLRSILLQLRYEIGAEPVSARLELEGGRSTADLDATEVTWGVPEAVALPSSAAYLVSTGLVGPTVTVEDAPREPAFFRDYEDHFVHYSDVHAAGTGEPWKDNYYDRALAHYAYWVRTADAVYFERATRLVHDYIEQYVERNDYRVTPRNMHTEGMELHYLLTGDEGSREAVGRLASRMSSPFPNSTTHGYGIGNNDGTEGRIQARMLQLYFTAWRLQAGGSDWGEAAREAVDMILGTQSDDGAYRFDVWCDHHSYYMTGLVNDALIKYYEGFEADPRILDAVGRSLDFMWEGWLPDAGAFPYLSGSCSGAGGPSPSPDLNMLIVVGYGWYAARTGDDSYRERGDEVFAGGVRGAYLEGSKQFNENYYDSFLYLGYR